MLCGGSGIDHEDDKYNNLNINDMRIHFIAILTIVLFLSSCAVEEVPTGGGTVNGLMENYDTRTSVTDDGYFTWSSGDRVWLHTTDGGIAGTLSSGEGTSSAQFSYGSFFGDMTGKAVYPYNASHSLSEEELNVVLPASYDLGTNLSNTNAAMYGVTMGGVIKFNHLAGVMRFTFKNLPAGTNKFMLTLDKKINGIFTVDLTEDHPILEAEEASTSSDMTITLNFASLSKESDVSLYIPLPVGTYNSLALGIYANDTEIWTYSNAVTNTINRRTLLLMPTVTIGGTIGGEIEGEDFYVDEYGINHGRGIEIDGVVWAPVNCGYHETDFKYGKLYQWGRKYGQGYNEDDAVPTLAEGGVSEAEGNLEINANVFYYMFADWAETRNNLLWNSGTMAEPVKTDYDPCPKGWRVPTYNELNRLRQNSSWGLNETGQSGRWLCGTNSYTESVPQIFFPAAGCREINGNANHRGYDGYYWASTPSEYTAHNINFSSSDQTVTFGRERAMGFSVRCVQE